MPVDLLAPAARTPVDLLESEATKLPVESAPATPSLAQSAELAGGDVLGTAAAMTNAVLGIPRLLVGAADAALNPITREYPKGTAFGDRVKSFIASTHLPTPGYGKDVASVVNAPFDVLSSIGHSAGKAVLRVTKSPLAAAITEGTIEGAPALLGFKSDEGAAKVKAAASMAADDVDKIVAPEKRGPEAKVAANLLRARNAQMAIEVDRAHQSLNRFNVVVDGMPDEARFRLIHDIESGAEVSPELKPLVTSLRSILDTDRKDVQSLGKGALSNYIENYFPHLWKLPDKASEVYGRARSSLEGRKGFLKERTHATFEDGLKAGLEPLSTNPIEIAMLRHSSMRQFIMGQKYFADLKEAGLAKFVRFGEDAPPDSVPLNDKIAKVQHMSSDENGLVMRGQYYVPAQAGLIVDRFLSPGLLGQYRSLEGIHRFSNLLNFAQLGFSAYHAGFTTIDTVISQNAMAVEHLMERRPFDALKTFASSPAAPFSSFIRGGRLSKAMLARDELPDGELKDMVDAVVKGGGRRTLDEWYRNNAPRQFTQYMRRKEYSKAAGISLSAALEKISSPILQHLVPRQKLGVFYALAKKEMASRPDMGRMEQLDAFSRIWDSVDNRLGQMTYDNLFWHKSLKDALFLSVRAVGWDVGTVREIGGGIFDLRRLPKQLVERRLSHRTAYVISLPLTTALMGATYQYLATGSGPQSIKDYYYPNSGGGERVSLPTYSKDVYAYGTHPIETLGHKANPAISAVIDMLNNQDFYGGNIRNPNDPFVKQIADEAIFMSSQLVPFSIENARQMLAKGDRKQALLSFVGITPAPASIVNPIPGEMYERRVLKEEMKRRSRER